MYQIIGKTGTLTPLDVIKLKNNSKALKDVVGSELTVKSAFILNESESGDNAVYIDTVEHGVVGGIANDVADTMQMCIDLDVFKKGVTFKAVINENTSNNGRDYLTITIL